MRVCQRMHLHMGMASSSRVSAEARRADSMKGSPPVTMTSQISGCAADVGERSFEFGGREIAVLLRADHFAAEAEAAIDRTDMARALSSTRSGIAMHDAFDRLVRLVANRVGTVLRGGSSSSCVERHELARDQDRRDRRGRSGRRSAGVIAGHRRWLSASSDARARGAGRDEIVGGAQRSRRKVKKSGQGGASDAVASIAPSAASVQQQAQLLDSLRRPLVNSLVAPGCLANSLRRGGGRVAFGQRVPHLRQRSCMKSDASSVTAARRSGSSSGMPTGLSRLPRGPAGSWRSRSLAELLPVIARRSPPMNRSVFQRTHSGRAGFRHRGAPAGGQWPGADEQGGEAGGDGAFHGQSS